MSPRNLYEMLEHTALCHPDAPAVEHGREVMSYAALLGRVNELRDKLLARGVRPGDRIALMVARDMDEPALLFAVSACRAVFVSLNRLWKPAQVDHGLRAVAPRFLIAAQGVAGLPEMVTPIALDDLLRGPAPSITSAAPPVPSPLDMAAIIFTSGSSGFPKGVMHANSGLLQWTDSTVEYLGNHSRDRVLAVLPLAFGYGLNQLLSMVRCGGCYRIAQSVLLPDIAAELAGHAITGLAGIPNFWRDFARVLPGLGLDGGDFALRYVTNAGGHCPVPVLDEVRSQLQQTDMVLMYGTTETLRTAYLPPHLFERKIGAIGVPVPGADILLLDADGNPCRPGEIGEIVHRGPTVAQGYFGAADRHCDRFRPLPAGLDEAAPDETVCFTGDLARLDDDGILWFESRRDRQLKINGFRISPAEIEEVAKELDWVDDAVALCVKAPDRAEAIHLVVALQAEREAPAETELTRFLRQRVANYMVPAKVHFWGGALPRTANGKTDFRTVEHTLSVSPLLQSA